MNTEQAVGLTPMIMRLAATYLLRGVGTYGDVELGFDEVRVTPIRPWERSDTWLPFVGDYSMGMQVSFYRAGRRVQWVDFMMGVSGGGGSPVIKELVLVNEEEE